MKKMLSILFAIAMAGVAVAQAPGGINYQAVARDNSGSLITNDVLNVRITVYSGAGASTQVYQETHGVTTNAYGLFDLRIGMGSPVSGTFSGVNWGSDEHHLQVEVDNGSGYINMGTTQMMSVPYALYAESSGSGSASLGLNDLTDVNTTGVTTSQVLSWDGSNWVPVTTSGGTVYSAGTGLSLSGTTFNNTAPDQTVTLTGGGSTSISGTYPNFNISSTDNNTTYSAGTGLTLSGTTFSAQNSSAIWNANMLQGRTVASTAPTTGQVLQWNGSQWAPATASGGSSPWTLASGNVYRTSGNVGIGTSNPAHKLHVVSGVTLRGSVTDWSSIWSGNDYAGAYFNFTGGSTASTNYYGISAKTTGTNGFNVGMFGLSDGVSSGSNQGLTGYAVNASTSNVGVLGVTEGNNTNNTTRGVYGLVEAVGNSTIGNFSQGVYGYVDGSGFVNRGVQGTAFGTATSSQGLAGFALATGDGSGSTENFGVIGVAQNSPDLNMGVYAISNSASGGDNFAVYATASGGATNYAGYFDGDVMITGNISKGSGTFKIDHPLDPSNKYLVHSFVESPDMMNVYSGNITTDANGEAVVELPAYFEASNKDFRYQLTPIGQFAQLIVLEEVENNQFVVKSDKPNVKLSWTVIATRDDPYAQEHRIVDEVEKTGKEKGKYLHPELYGQPETEAVYYRDNSTILPESPQLKK